MLYYSGGIPIPHLIYEKTGGGALMQIIQFSTGNVLCLKKKHPCGSDLFKVLRCGSDVKIVCTSCGRELMLPREKLEKMIKTVISE